MVFIKNLQLIRTRWSLKRRLEQVRSPASHQTAAEPPKQPASSGRNCLASCLANLLGFFSLFLCLILVVGAGIWYLEKQRPEAAQITPAEADDSSEPTAALAVTEPYDGALSRSESVILSGRSLPSSWLIVANGKMIRPVQTSARGFFSTKITLTPGVNRLVVTAFSPQDWPRTKVITQLYLPEILQENWEDVWLGQLRRVNDNQLTFSAWTGGFRGDLVKVDYSAHSAIYRGHALEGPVLKPSDLIDGEFIIVVGTLSGEKRFDARLFLATSFPDYATVWVTREDQTPRLQPVDGFEVTAWDALGSLESFEFSLDDGALRPAALGSLDSHAGAVILGYRNGQQPSQPVWTQVVTIPTDPPSSSFSPSSN